MSHAMHYLILNAALVSACIVGVHDTKHLFCCLGTILEVHYKHCLLLVILSDINNVCVLLNHGI